jgi:hypothetical protein
LVSGEAFRHIAARFAVSTGSLQRHKAAHLPASLTKARDAEEIIKADDLLDQARSLQEKALSILSKAEAAGDLRGALGAIRESRGNLELLAKMLGLGHKDRAANPVYVPEVGYDMNELLKNPEVREMVLALDAKMRALTGGEGIILEGAVTNVK